MKLVEELQKCKEDLAALETERSKEEGRLEQAMEDLKSAGFDTLEEAREELERQRVLREAAEKEAEEFLVDFKEKYAKLLN